MTISKMYGTAVKKFLPEYLENTLAGSRNTISRSSAYFEKGNEECRDASVKIRMFFRFFTVLFSGG